MGFESPVPCSEKRKRDAALCFFGGLPTWMLRVSQLQGIRGLPHTNLPAEWTAARAVSRCYRYYYLFANSSATGMPFPSSVA